MSPIRPRNIILLVADSLRYDSVYQGDSGLSYLSGHGATFSQARAAGCWTLPATAGMFTGLVPHQHGATAQTRGLLPEPPTLASRLREAGWFTAQVTANVATTHIFGLERGFDEMRHVWKLVPPHHKRLFDLLLLLGKPRLRRKIWSRDLVAGRLAEDLEASKVWLQDTLDAVFDETRRLLREHEASGKPSFLFLNLMETHFPYHIAPLFETASRDLLARWREIRTLFHFVNQTWLIDDSVRFSEEEFALLRRRQRETWARVAPRIDAFLRELHEGKDNLVVFCSDHGDAFGEQGWLYHFSNVTDGGNRVPLVYLRPGDEASRRIDAVVSARDLFHSLLRDAGLPSDGPHLVDEPERSVPYLESFWYNNQGRTLPRYRFNQNLLFAEGRRYLRRQGAWYVAPPQVDGEEPPFEPLPLEADPLQDLAMEPEHRRFYVDAFAGHEAFCRRLPS